MTATLDDRFEDRTMWEVFARRKFEEPLAHVGTVAADDPDLARVYARTIFNEFSWVEMVLSPRPSALTANQVVSEGSRANTPPDARTAAGRARGVARRQ